MSSLKSELQKLLNKQRMDHTDPLRKVNFSRPMFSEKQKVKDLFSGKTKNELSVKVHVIDVFLQKCL